MRWIDEQLQARDLLRKDLAEAIPTLNEQKLSLVMSGRHRLTADEADQIRRFFGYRLPDDPPTTAWGRIQDQLAMLDERQRRAVELYLAALSGADSGPREAV